MRAEHWFYTVPLRLRSLFRRSRVECELDEEFSYHIGMKVEEFVAAGLDPGAARQAALRAMDSLTQRKEECRDRASREPHRGGSAGSTLRDPVFLARSWV